MNNIHLRTRIYVLLIVLAAASAVGRVLAAAVVFDPASFRDKDDPADGRSVWPEHPPKAMPTFGSNDRSRWATVRALVDDGTYEVGRRDPALANEKNTYGDVGIVFEDGWKTVDKVLHPERQKFYSSKPPLLPTLAAGEYWLFKKLLGWTFTDDRWKVVRVSLITINVLPLIVYLALLARLVERHGRTDWGRCFVLAVACFATFMTPFITSFNNHTLAACFALFALYPAFDLWMSRNNSLDGTGEGDVASSCRPVAASRFILSGFFAGFTVAVELPAAAFAAALFGLFLWRDLCRTLVFFTPAAALPVAALLLTNYLAIGQPQPAYAEFGGPWYEYEGSHWKDPGKIKRGIDFADESKAVYAFHFLLGHHGLFSLTPVFLLSAAGIAFGLPKRSDRAPGEETAGSENGCDSAERHHPLPWIIYPLTLYLLVVVVGFYLIRTHNYGGVTCGPRWLIWLTPFLILTLVPIMDWLADKRWGRGLGYLLLAISVASVSFHALNPWKHPWLYLFMESQGWIRY